MRIAQVLKSTLQEQGRSQRWLALKIGMKPKILSSRFSVDNFSAKELVLIAEALDFDLNILKGCSLMPAHYDVYKIYDEAIDNADFNFVSNCVSQHLPELNEQQRITLATLIIYLLECDIDYVEFVELMCGDLLTIEQLLENYYWFYDGIKTEDALAEFVKTQLNGELIIGLPRKFTQQGCLVFNDPPFTKFEGNKLSYSKPDCIEE